jgi:hypothetical protein
MPTGTTDSTGTVTFTVSATVHTVAASASGFNTLYQDVYVDPSGGTNTSFDLSAALAVIFKAVDQNGMPVPGVALTIKTIAGATVATGTTAGDGTFATALYPAQYTVTATAAGYANVAQPAMVDPASGISGNIVTMLPPLAAPPVPPAPPNASLLVRVRDASGNPVSGAIVTVT